MKVCNFRPWGRSNLGSIDKYQKLCFKLDSSRTSQLGQLGQRAGSSGRTFYCSGATGASRRFQDRSGRAQDGSKSAPGGLKTAPRALREASRRLQRPQGGSSGPFHIVLLFFFFFAGGTGRSLPLQGKGRGKPLP